MGLRIRRSFKLFPGVRVNIGMSGLSASIGVPGAMLNASRRGLRGTVGIPGSGLSFSTMLLPSTGAPSRTEVTPEPEVAYWQSPDIVEPPRADAPHSQQTGMREIKSAAVECLTTKGLVNFHRMITDARTQRSEIDTDLGSVRMEYAAQQEELSKRKSSFLRWFFRRRIAQLEETIPQLAAESERLEAWLKATQIEVTFESEDAARRAFARLVEAYDILRTSAAIWDVTSDRDANKIAERTSASRVIERRQVQFYYAVSDLIRFDGKALRFANANGDDILIYPGLILMPRLDGQFALLDVRDVTIEAKGVDMIETQHVPSDTKVIGKTWTMVNKDGTPDRRFRNNQELPVCRYGQMCLTSSTGLSEEYHFSNAEAAISFGEAYAAYRKALSESNHTIDSHVNDFKNYLE